MKALKELGFKKIFRFFWATIIMVFFNLLLFPPLRLLFLRILGVKIGKDTVLLQIKFINLYRQGFKALAIGKRCFLADDVLFDLADKIIIDDEVTIAYGAMLLTHLNVGYADHPLQKFFPAFNKPIIIEKGAFIGARSIILPGVKIGREALVAAGALVNKNVPSRTMVAGVPARIIKKIK